MTFLEDFYRNPHGTKMVIDEYSSVIVVELGESEMGLILVYKDTEALLINCEVERFKKDIKAGTLSVEDCIKLAIGRKLEVLSKLDAEVKVVNK